MPKVPGVIPSAAAGVPYHSEKRSRNDKNNVKKITSPSYNPQKFTEVSVMHLLNDSKPKALKKASYGGSNKKIGCSWTQFTGNIDAAIDHVALSIDDKYVSYQHEKTARITYFMFYNEESAEKCMNTPIYYNGKAVELYQTNNYDFSAYKNKKSGKFHTFGMKFLFKKIIDSFKIPTFLEIKNNFFNIDLQGINAQKQPTSQDQLAKNSKSLDELQKLANEQKSEQKNSKEKDGQCIISNTYKKPVEIGLELSDQEFVIESSCPPITNFKKEWDKSDENYTENNVSVAVIDMDLVNELADNNGFIDAEMQ
ncbi:hypothetical protein BB561_006201 [Smittium simulii]|uniref:Uncharacterized protein n=1 Tax=Smittium simulii TaxID=133385 RepID=A0A2T9Y611_9FUNG|nr:hypothetical protein BB561_006201 [Smittium simulii]